MASEADPAVDRLTEIVVRALRALGAAGQPVPAARLAADAWVATRHDHPRAAERLNGVMHHLARLESAASEAGRSTAMADRILDVRTEPPVRRHSLIFDVFAALEPGAAFELVNDHDPKPLYYQLAAEHPGTFSWDYLESGPEVWRVRIGRTVTATAGGVA